MITASMRSDVETHIEPYQSSALQAMFAAAGISPHAIKFVNSQWAPNYASPQRLKVSQTPALTWGTGTYVSPVVFPLSSVLYGRVGLVTDFDPTDWRIFDATRPAARASYLRWARAQPNFSDLVFTVHSTFANHLMRDRFRRDFQIDCVLFHPDQEAELHTDRSQHVWMLVTDWLPDTGEIDARYSDRLSRARFTVLIDEEFDLADSGGLPIQSAARKIEPTTLGFANHQAMPVSVARSDPDLGQAIIWHYANDRYLHIYVEP